MKNKITYRKISIGLFGQFILLIAFLFCVNTISKTSMMMIPILFLPLSLMTMMDTSEFKTDENKYRNGIMFFGFITFNKWLPITEKCYLNIKPKAKITSFSSGRIDHGSMTSFVTGLYFIDRIKKRTILLEKGKYSNVKKASIDIAKVLQLNVKDYKTEKST